MNGPGQKVPDRMVIVGAGHVGGRAAQALRQLGWTGEILLLGEEAHLPYERPPLSKGLLTGERDGASCALRPAEAYRDEAIAHRIARVESLDPEARALTLAGGERFAYRALLLATGGRPRSLAIPGSDLLGVLALRSLDDAARLAARLGAGQPLLVIGGGFIGLEVAAAARRCGCQVTIIESAPRLLGRAVPAPIAGRILALHRAHGVEIRLQAQPQAISAGADGILILRLADGSELAGATILAGIGIEPRSELARAAGLAVGRGISVDSELATGAPGIFAAGDVAEFPSPLTGLPIRQESWHNAETQARIAAENMLGGHAPYRACPWVWSDQYDHVLQVAGEPALGEDSLLRRLGPDAEIHFHLDREGRPVGISGVGPFAVLAKEFKLARLLLERRRTPPPERLADATVALKSLLSA